MTPDNGLENLPAIESDPLVTPEPKPAPPTPDPIESFKGEVTGAFEGINKTLEEISARQAEIESKITPPAADDTPKTWEPKTWDEFPEKAAEAARKVLEEDKAQQQRVESEREARDQQLETYLNDQEKELVTAGRLPDVVDENNPDDPGRKARAELFGLAAHLGSTDIKAVDTYRKAMNESGITYDPRVRQFIRSDPPMQGADVPVRSSSQRASTSPNRALTLKELREGDFDFITERHAKRYGL